jgi:hypothetical protein
MRCDPRHACVPLISTVDGDISRCWCGRYHVRINATTLHLTASQFDRTARLFKLALGMLAAQPPCGPMRTSEAMEETPDEQIKQVWQAEAPAG